MITKLFASGAVVAGMLVSAAAIAEPAVVFDMGGKFDKSFNEGIFNGVERYKEETGNDYRDFEVTAEAQREQALRRFARAGSDPIIAVGSPHGTHCRRSSRASRLLLVGSCLPIRNGAQCVPRGALKFRSRRDEGNGELV